MKKNEPRSPPGRIAEAWTEAAWLSLAVLVPLHFERFSRHVFESHKVALLFAAAAAIGLGWVVRTADGGVPGGRPARSRLLRALALFVAVETLATLLSVDPWTAFRGTVFRRQGLLSTLAYVLVFLAIVRAAGRREVRERLVTATIVASVPICLYALAQRLGLDPVSWGGSFGTRVTSTLGNPIFLGAWVAMASFPTLARFLGGNTLYGAVLGLQAATLVASGSRGPWLGAAAGAVLFCVLAVRARVPWLGRRSLRLLPVAALAVLLLLPGAGGAPGAEAAEESGALNGLWQDVGDSLLRTRTAAERVWYWQGYLSMYLARAPVRYVPHAAATPAPADRLRLVRPWLGYGPEVATEVFSQNAPRELFERYGPTGTADRAHNEAWDRLVAGGALGLATWTLLLAAIGRYGLAAAGFRMRRRDRTRWAASIAGGACGLGVTALIRPGPFAFGVAFQTGLCAGILAYAMFGARRGRPPRLAEWGLLAAVVSHLVEGTVGFEVAATRLLFWSFAGLLVAAALDRAATAPPAEAAARRTRAATAVTLAVAGASLAFDLAGRDSEPLGTACADLVRSVAGDSLRAIGLYAGWLAVLGLFTLALAERGGSPRRTPARVRFAVVLGGAAFAFAVHALALRPVRADILDRSGMRLRTHAGTSPGAALLAASEILDRTVRLAPRTVEYRFNFAEAASAAALALPGDAAADATASPASYCDAGVDRDALLASAVGAVRESRRWHPASPLVPLNLSYLHERWARVSVDPARRAEHARTASAWLARAREMFSPGLRVEPWGGAGQERGP